MTANTDGRISTLFLISSVSAVGQPATGSSPSSSRASGSRLGVIIGLAVGVPIFLVACALAGCTLWRQRKANRASATSSHVLHQNEIDMSKDFGYQVGHVPPAGRSPELDSFPVAFGHSKSGRASELDGSPHASAIPSTTSTKQPPDYTPALRAVNEEPAELWGGYVPDRPPVSAGGGSEEPMATVEGSRD
jgi:hypothetical protein